MICSLLYAVCPPRKELLEMRCILHIGELRGEFPLGELRREGEVRIMSHAPTENNACETFHRSAQLTATPRRALKCQRYCGGGARMRSNLS